jgi:hypothetical protein
VLSNDAPGESTVVVMGIDILGNNRTRTVETKVKGTEIRGFLFQILSF